MKLILIGITIILIIFPFVYTESIFSAIYLSKQRSKLAYGAFARSDRSIPLIVACSVISNSIVINDILYTLNDSLSVKFLDESSFNSLIKNCKEVDIPPTFEDSYSKTFKNLKDLTKLLFIPGTKYCGPGKISKGYNDLGVNVWTDSCCRRHDHCPMAIGARETKYNLTNKQFHTSSHCNCDESFKWCLRKAFKKEPVAGVCGLIYFDILKSRCFYIINNNPKNLVYRFRLSGSFIKVK